MPRNPHERAESGSLTNSFASAAEETRLVPSETEKDPAPTVTVPPLNLQTATAGAQPKYQPNPKVTLLATVLFPFAAIYFIAATSSDTTPEGITQKIGMPLGSTIIFASVLLMNLQQRFPALSLSEKKHLLANAAANLVAMGPTVGTMLYGAIDAIENGERSWLDITKVTAIALFTLHTLMNFFYLAARALGYKKNPTHELLNILPGLIGAIGFFIVNATSLHQAQNPKARTTPLDLTIVSIKFIAMLSRFFYVATREVMQARADARAAVAEENKQPAEAAPAPAAPKLVVAPRFEELSDDEERNENHGSINRNSTFANKVNSAEDVSEKSTLVVDEAVHQRSATY